MIITDRGAITFAIELDTTKENAKKFAAVLEELKPNLEKIIGKEVHKEDEYDQKLWLTWLPGALTYSDLVAKTSKG